MMAKAILFFILLFIIIAYIITFDRFFKPFLDYTGFQAEFRRTEEHHSTLQFNGSEYTTTKKIPIVKIPIVACSHWHYRVSGGLFSSGAPYVRINDVCVQDTKIWFLFPSQEESRGFYNCLTKCCSSEQTQTKECSRLRIPESLCHHLGLYHMFVSVSDRTFDDLPAPLLSGRSYLLDTAIEMRYHFGHTVSKLLQLYLLNEKFEQILINRVDRLPGGFHYGINETNIRNLYDITIGKMNSVTVLAKNNMTCVEELWWVPNYEQMFFSWSAAQQWRTLLYSQYGLAFQKCPPPRALFLQRMEGMRRRIMNSFVVDELAKELGISLERAYIGSINTTQEHIRLFSSFGLMISTHSSALKALIFASPNAVVIEITGRYIPDWRASPFQLGTEFLDIHYVVSRWHQANWSSCIGYCGQPDNDRDADLFVNITSLRSALLQGLASQRRSCPTFRY